jgi:hypothetical protein
MAQIWLTYEELGVHANCSAHRARDQVIANNWPRRHCSDGQTRVKLPPELAHAYMLGYAGHHTGRGGNIKDMLASLQAALDEAGVLSGDASMQPRPAEEPDIQVGQKGLLRRAS